MCAVASGVKFITEDGQNVPWYSSWENNTVTFFPLAYSDSAPWIAAAASAKVCGVRGWNYWDIVGRRPEPLAVKNNWWYMWSSTSILVNHDFLSSTTLERYVLSIRSSLTWIRSSVSERESNWKLRTTVRRALSANRPQTVLIFSFKYVYFGA